MAKAPPKGGNDGSKKVTGKKAGEAASDVLRDKRTGDKSKTTAGSAMSQRPKKK